MSRSRAWPTHGSGGVVDVAIAAVAIERDEGVGDAADDGVDLGARLLGVGAGPLGVAARRLGLGARRAGLLVDAAALDGARDALGDDLEELDVGRGPRGLTGGREPRDAEQDAAEQHGHDDERAIAVGRDDLLDGRRQQAARARQRDHLPAREGRPERLGKDREGQAREAGGLAHRPSAGRVPLVGQREHARRDVEPVVVRALGRDVPADTGQRPRDGFVDGVGRGAQQLRRDERRDAIVGDSRGHDI